MASIAPEIKPRHGEATRPGRPGASPLAMLVTFFLLLPVWVLLSGQFDYFHLSLGVISCALIAYTSADLWFTRVTPGRSLATAGRFLGYLPWILYQIWLANFHVLRLALHPRMKELIDPHLVRFKSDLVSDAAKVTLAHSITLTPGTITVRVDLEGNFLVHAIDRATGDVAALKEMEAKVAQTMGET